MSMPTSYVALTLAVALPACGPQDVLIARVVDASDNAPLRGAAVSIERGGLYIDNPDKTVGNPAYVYGAVTDDEGFFELPLQGAEKIGIHTFIGGYRYGALTVNVLGEVVGEITQGKHLPGDAPPTVSEVKLSKARVAPSEEVEVSGVVIAGQYADLTGHAKPDPLSEEIVLVQPDTHWSFALDPPAPGGMPGHWPDGLWTGKFTAPAKPGTYRYLFSATSEHCVTAELVPLELTVE